MTAPSTRRLRAVLIVVPVLAGVLALVAAVRGRPAPALETVAEPARPARVIEVAALPVVPRAIAHGTVAPGGQWSGVAQVGGIVVERHPALKKGELLPEGAVLLRLDPTDQELAVAKIAAQQQATAAQLLELSVREANTRRSVEIERDALSNTAADLERRRSLRASGASSSAMVEAAENAVLAQRQKLQTQQSALELIPAQRRVLEATAALQDAQLAEARRNLERTVIRMPFAGRITVANVEVGQYAGPGTVVATADAIDTAEVAAQVPLDRLRSVVASVRPGPIDPQAPALPAAMEQLGARVRLVSGGWSVDWPARFARIGDAVDPLTRTMDVVVAVDNPYGQAVPGERPPLTKGMFVEVELRGRALPPVAVIPRTALHADRRVHVVGPDDRLTIRGVEVGQVMGGFVTVTGGLVPGDRVVVSDLMPALEGMRLAPVRDEAAERALAAAATGAETAP